MLNLFPQLIVLEQFAPLILRLVLGVIFISHGWAKISNRENKFIIATGFAELVSGAFVLAGFLTQPTSLVIIADRILIIWKTRQNYEFHIAVIAMAVSLLFFGAGLFAIDLPHLL